MKKIILFIVAAVAINYAQAQKLNQDTLAKYSKKTEQARVFNKVAADIHLDAAQSVKFNQISATYADKAITIVSDKKTSRCDKLDMLKQTLKEYSVKIKQVLSPEQFAMLRSEHDKHHFVRRFVTFND
jgi:hypothetical protein